MDDSQILEALSRHFGHASFRRPQGDVVKSILSGRDTLAIMPTGGGKSLCYQLPAMLLDGITIVVSPLIALMKDQVDALCAKGIDAAMLNSSQSWAEQSEVLARLSRGGLKLAYVAPERFRAQSFTRALRGAKISLFAVDEAHCISQWGHDFRPDYMRLGEALESLGRPTCAAFTATATPDVREDILRQLGMREPSVFVSGFARKNLSFNVREVSGKAEKFARVCAIADKYKTGIVYCATRKSAEELSKKLWGEGVRHIVYHGAMTPAERDAAQEAFMGGREQIAVATNAFGMGIDRPDIRFVCHYELTGSVEALYQEAGRAGRDGAESYCEMLLMYADKRVQEFFIEGANPSADFIEAVYRAVRDNCDNANECAMPIDALAEETADIMRFGGGRRRARGGKFARLSGANAMAVSSALGILRRLGYVERFDIPSRRARGTRLLDPDLPPSRLDLPESLLAEKRRRDEAKLRDVLRYAYSKQCRQKWILEYFGEDCPEPCGKCDVCMLSSAPAERQPPLSPDEILEVRKALSGVARMSHRAGARQWLPRFGRDKIVKCLAGSRDAKITSSGLDSLSTYGILKGHGAKFCSELFSSLVDFGLVSITDGEYPLAAITDFGVSVMLGEVSELRIAYPREISKLKKVPALQAKKSAKKSPREKPETDVPDFAAPLYAELSALRSQIAAKAHIPVYRVFTNAVLRGLAVRRPADAESAMEISGIGKINSKKYLNRFLDLVRNFTIRNETEGKI